MPGDNRFVVGRPTCPRAPVKVDSILLASRADVPLRGVRPTPHALPSPLCRYASIILPGDDAWLLTELSNVVAYACRHSRAEDRPDVHQHRHFIDTSRVAARSLSAACMTLRWQSASYAKTSEGILLR